MFLEHLLNQTNAPLLERVVKFAAARQKLIAEDIANVDTPGFRQKDLDPAQFMALLRQRIEQRNGNSTNPPGLDVSRPSNGILFHDGNNRSMEQLETDQKKTGLMYTVAMEMLRQQYQEMQLALKEKVS